MSEERAAFDLFAETRARFGEAPRRGDVIAKASKIKMPPWLRSADRLHRAEAERARVLEQGRLVRSWVVMANSLLFAPGPNAHPALVVYAPGDDVDLETLEEMASLIFGRRGSKPVDPDLAAFVGDLADGARVLARAVPASIAHGRTLRIATVLLLREHLPRGYLGASFLPLVVHDATDASIVLPSWLWASDLEAGWIDMAADA
jgi:hypothetical protein